MDDSRCRHRCDKMAGGVVSYLTGSIVRMNVATVGLDVAMNVFQVHGVEQDCAPVIRRELRRADMLSFFSSLPRCLVGLEACAGAHHWARELQDVFEEC